MPALNWGLVSDGGVFESLMHAILYAQDPCTILFGRPGKDAGQDARTGNGSVIYQAKYRQTLNMDGAVDLATHELKKIVKYRESTHANFCHWEHAKKWILVAAFSVNPNDETKWRNKVVPAYQKVGLSAEYWSIETLEGKLAEHPEVRDVFFGEENRVLVGLKEAHNLLRAECVGSLSLDLPMVGRDAELKHIIDFAQATERRVLPVIGPGGIGKSRILYESLVRLSRDGWRVLWGLSGTMVRSSQWFRLLNGTQKTCVVLDNPDDPSILRVVIEQLAAVERRNWRVIIACRPEKAEILRRYKTNSHVDDSLELSPLDETASHALMNALLDDGAEQVWLHQVYRCTRGVPSWLCLIAELTKKKLLSDLPQNADDVASTYVNSCLEVIAPEHRMQGLTLLRWLALWGSLRLEPKADEIVASFLKSLGVPRESFRDLLSSLVGTRLVRKFGTNKCLHEVEPLIIRQQILSSWLFHDSDGTYEASDAGTELVSRLVAGEIPLLDSVLQTLSQLASSRLADQDTVVFLGPVFNEMSRVAMEGDVLAQHRVANMVEKAGAADPEGALEVLTALRENVTADAEVNAPPWGLQTVTHDSLKASIPWTLFQIAERVIDKALTRRYIEEFRQLVALEDKDAMQPGSGKGPRQLLKRLLCDEQYADAFRQTAHDLAVSEISSSKSRPFVGLLCECLLNPIRESTDWVSNWTLTISRRAIAPESLEWNLAASVRAKVFEILDTSQETKVRTHLWQVLNESHHSFHRAMLHDNVKGEAIVPYRSVLAEDLRTCVEMLNSHLDDFSIEEATQAREIWEWYLKYGKDDELVDLARRCEQKYNDLFPWRLHDFFRFDTESELAPETERVAGLLRNASKPDIAKFFAEAQRYLIAARKGGQDSADNWRISTLVEELADELELSNAGASPLTIFVTNVLAQQEPDNLIAWEFAVKMCQRHLLNTKNVDQDAVAGPLEHCLKLAGAKDRLLLGLYSHVHPMSTGPLTRTELKAVLELESSFAHREFFVLLGNFVAVDTDEVQTRLRVKLEALRNEQTEASQCLGDFIRAAYITALRYEWSQTETLVRGIISMIIDFQLDGALLGRHDLEGLRDHAEFRLNMRGVTQLMQSRITLESRPKPSEQFEIVPYEFNVSKWCRFDSSIHEEVNAFHELCRMSLTPSFTALYWIPKYVAQLDPSGEQVAMFIDQHLTENPDLEGKALARLGYLASAYREESAPWAAIAGPICSKAQSMRRDERERVYFGLARKETDVISSMPGEIPEYYVNARESAANLLENEPADSPLYGYRQWSLRRAEEDLRRAKQVAEEDENG